VAGISATPYQDNLRYFAVAIEGPGDSPYENGVFQLELFLPADYPMAPPKVRFLTKIYHPNVDKLGRICLDILKDEAHHIKFQNQRLLHFFKEKSVYAKAFAVAWYCLFFFGTIHAIWLDHHKAFEAGGINKREFFRMMYQKFFKTISYLHQKEATFQTRLEVV